MCKQSDEAVGGEGKKKKPGKVMEGKVEMKGGNPKVGGGLVPRERERERGDRGKTLQSRKQQQQPAGKSTTSRASAAAARNRNRSALKF